MKKNLLWEKVREKSVIFQKKICRNFFPLYQLKPSRFEQLFSTGQRGFNSTTTLEKCVTESVSVIWRMEEKFNGKKPSNLTIFFKKTRESYRWWSRPQLRTGTGRLPAPVSFQSTFQHTLKQKSCGEKMVPLQETRKKIISAWRERHGISLIFIHQPIKKSSNQSFHQNQKN